MDVTSRATDRRLMIMNEAVRTIVSDNPAVRNRSAESLFRGRSRDEIIRSVRALDEFRRGSDNLYHRARASLLVFAALRIRLLNDPALPGGGRLPRGAVRRLRTADWEGAIRILSPLLARRPAAPAASALAEAHYRLAFDSLLRQVKLSIGRSAGNEWLFSAAALADYPLRLRPECLARGRPAGDFPVGIDLCPVRIDPCHSGWSDIFFLAMDYPEGARVVNLSVDIAAGEKRRPRPPIECLSRVIPKPLIRLVSRDLGAAAEVRRLPDLFHFEGDPLRLLKAGVIASGVVPPALDKSDVRLGDLLRRLAGPGRGIEIVTHVRDLPIGSRMAVSTALLNAVITRLMRMTGQVRELAGGLSEAERRLVLSRTILGEWLGGSGGGWQDSGGLWPGIKIFSGARAERGDAEFGSSRGRLLPRVRVIPPWKLPPDIEEKLAAGLVLVHGGMAQNVGPFLEMATEKYLLRYGKEWRARLREKGYFRRIVGALIRGDLQELGRGTSEDWEGGTKVIIPQATNAYTEELIARMKHSFGARCRGFLMLGGAAGGGMAFVVDPRIRAPFARTAVETMKDLQRKYSRALPFARRPQIFAFRLNGTGIRSRWAKPDEIRRLSRPLPEGGRAAAGWTAQRWARRRERAYAVDGERQEANRRLLRTGKIGLRRNRLPGPVSDARPGDVVIPPPEGSPLHRELRRRGNQALREGKAAVVTLSGGAGSRWAGGSGVIKALNPFLFIEGRHRSFLEIHLAKSEKTARETGYRLPHAFTASPLNRAEIGAALRRSRENSFSGRLYLSPSPFLLRRLIPAVRDLRASSDPRVRRFAAWAKKRGEGADFHSPDPFARLHPPGHWFEIPALLLNGALGRIIEDNPRLAVLFVHNLDTLGANLDPAILALHLSSGAALTFEVTPRLWGDSGGFLARTGGRTRIVEGLALPREEDAFRLSWYNSMTCWISLDRFLDFLGLTRAEARDAAKSPRARKRVARALQRIENRLPTYVTLKEAREADAAGRGGTVPVAQCEKLWGDMTSFPDLSAAFIAVERKRGQQLKDPDLLDHWMRDGSKEHLLKLCRFQKPGRA